MAKNQSGGRRMRKLAPVGALTLTLLLGACGGGSADEASAANGWAGEPKLETPVEQLDAALHCTPFEHPDKPPVLLVHGTFTNGAEQYEWTYIPLLSERGYDVCAVTYPDRGLGDMQVSAEYVVHALRRIHAETGRKVAMIGHSQGAGMPRWALKWWPSARAAVADFVLQAGPNHGTAISDPLTLLAGLGLPLPSTGGLPVPLPAAVRQFAPDSLFTTAVNRGDETPGDIDYTNLYTQFDELVQPVSPVPTAALDWQQNNPKVANLLLQDLCPGRFVDHVSIGLTDRLAFELTLDAISQPGPANPERAGGAALCGLAAIIPDQIISNSAASGLVNILRAELSGSAPAPHLVSEEPPLKDYAR